jgi:hypothetical protein
MGQMKKFDELLIDLSERKAMSVSQRRKAGLRMKKLAKSSAFKNKVARKRLRLATPDQLMKRAQKIAKYKVIEKFASLSKQQYDALPPQQKMQIDNRVITPRTALINKIAKKQMKILKKQDIENTRKARENKK